MDDLEINDILQDGPKLVGKVIPVQNTVLPGLSVATTIKKQRHNGGRPIQWTEAKAMKLATEIRNEIVANPESITPSVIMGEIGYNPTCLYYLLEKYPLFKEEMQKIERLQEGKIADQSLKGKLNGRFALGYLQVKHGWQTKTEPQEVKVAMTGPIQIMFEVVKKNEPNTNL